MNKRAFLASVVVFLCGAVLGLAAETDLSKFMGHWKLNEAKSKFAPGAGKNTSVTYAPAGDSVKVTTDGVDKDGKPTHTEWTGSSTGRTTRLPVRPNTTRGPTFRRAITRSA